MGLASTIGAAGPGRLLRATGQRAALAVAATAAALSGAWLLSTRVAAHADACVAPFVAADGSATWHATSTDKPWATGPSSDGGGTVAHIADTGAQRYEAALESPPFVIASNEAVTFRQQRMYSWANTMSTLEIAIGDGPFVDILAAGGRFEKGGYDGHSLPTNPLGFRAAWAAAPDAETITRVDLPADAVGKTARLRFRIGSAGTGDTTQGWVVGELQCASVASN